MEAPLGNVSLKSKIAWKQSLWTLLIAALFDENPPIVEFDESCIQPLEETTYKP
jgi:hypothetical protein